ncbi:hypothetical protein [Anabaenopsis elenkinii]|jgi:hypothetical protein|uniref:Uncharacterized protein n=1 Tax=Anabaenopsis elenkinii CCIBt3563 TaxID=2779889 RepID=A0A7S6U6N2_9CYAN|nr:hypothetical protein [Anabaenopsis elenkinii]QOV24029.1 hypothetical protein IM676_07115 [Anabaenopsis elenkinii CCIBt3563]
MKFTAYRNAAMTICTLGLLGLMVGCWEITVSFEPVNEDINLPAAHIADSDVIGVAPVLDKTVTSTTINYETTQTNKIGDTSILAADGQGSTAHTNNQGSLRMSNQTNQPVRLALLTRQPQMTTSVVPAHWDFDPQEGSAKGLILSLPDENLKLEPGDIMVAFAQDGSRRYWGPYVVGKTSWPQWDRENQEWLLILTP